ncbi:Pyruvate/Phosphoenolpyruvate kinase-like domain-containing protein [Catenaria anguillulae PL171]|uniref:Pyruvate/Phosphoenolpyruvate kinase-like domain-containing protein n=1 Tax=Catenaria anguillulae PL171 TaxID=765915 RepID=A0A1Y2I5M5_9FUNG|nr:Pyruvate/Phosphoenolpyruvate kinase-like domain-containing protein [Catenaria anguillulae PL171]
MIRSISTIRPVAVSAVFKRAAVPALSQVNATTSAPLIGRAIVGVPESRAHFSSAPTGSPSGANNTASSSTGQPNASPQSSSPGQPGAATAATLTPASLLSRPERVRRSLFNVPGSDERKMAKAKTLGADSIVFDLEDGVPMDRKGSARQLVFDALESFDLGHRERAVRINAVGSGLEVDDLNVILHSTRLQCIVIPKVNTASDVQFVDRMIDSIAPESNRPNIRLIACIESAMGLLNLREIASSSPRLDALVYASEDLCADMGMVRTASRLELLYSRSAVVTAACAYGLQAIDLVCIDYKDHDVLSEECREGRQMGFTGKQAIHPGQIDGIQKHFSPTEAEVQRATKIVEGYREYVAKGKGALCLRVR